MRRELKAVNTAPDSENRMHGDEARRYGFAAGLVPGVDVLGYLAHEAVEERGSAWLGGGRLHGRLLAPVYDGEVIEVVRDRDGEEWCARVVGGRDTRAEATLSLLDSSGGAIVGDRDRFAVRALPAPDERLPASRQLLAPGTVLGTQVAGYHAARAPSYLDDLSETHAAFRVDGCAHPGWLLRFSNWALSSTVRLGPWIHVSSDAHFLRPVRDGDQLEVRAIVTDCYERKGHELVDLDVLYLVKGEPVAFVDHRAIWQPRVTTSGTSD
jgi:hypothetical protein